MTTAEALRLAQWAYPLDLVARLDYITWRRYICASDDREAWNEAYRLTRGEL